MSSVQTTGRQPDAAAGSVQREELPEEEEMLQTSLQRQDIPEEEEMPM